MSAGRVTITITDARGEVLIAHTENQFDYAPDSQVSVGSQPGPRGRPGAGAGDGAWLAWGAEREVNGDALGALGAYREGLRRSPGGLALLKAAGRLAISIGREREGEPWLAEYLLHVPADHEAAYYRGLARLRAGDVREARLALELARQQGPLRWAAERGLAQLDATRGQVSRAADRLARVAGANPDVQLEAAMLLRAVGGSRAGEASRWRTLVLQRDPSNPLARWEQVRAGGGDRTLRAELAADPSRIVAIATRYLEYGLHAEATGVLEAAYPTPIGHPEAGVPRPHDDPIAGYLALLARARRGLPIAAFQDSIGRRPVAGAFPHGALVRQALEVAVRAEPGDQTARFLLGMMEMQRGEVASAMARWDSVRAAGRVYPSLYRNLGAAALLLADTVRADALFEEGTRREPSNPGVWSGADSVKLMRRAPAAARAALLDGYPDKAGMPTALVYRYARALAAAGRYDDAERLFANRWFSRVEGGTNPRGVWMEVRAQRAVAAARIGGGQCDVARGIVRGLASPVRDLAFSSDGMAPFLTRDPVRSLVAEVARACP